jgi:hypothetical protein
MITISLSADYDISVFEKQFPNSLGVSVANERGAILPEVSLSSRGQPGKGKWGSVPAQDYPWG